jgi:prepilin-type N-terminal cleavage/methylation domain-containing protein/prepilin-type processing-associated H-X9-DG protein
MKRRTAFTLVELLVVIAIIALLMGILMPALSKVRRMAKATICRTSVRQWGLVFKLYGEDNDAKLPQSVGGGNLTEQEAYWIVATLSYYKDKGIRICPSTKIVRGPTSYEQGYGGTFACWGPYPKGGPNTWYADFDTGSYGINDWCATPPPGETWYWAPKFLTENAWKTQLVKGGDRIPLFGDSVTVDGFPLDDTTQGAPLSTEPPPYDGWSLTAHGAWNRFAMRLYCLPRHDGAANFAFLDGSVGAVPLRALWRLKWHRSFNVNGPWTIPSAVWPQWLLKFGDEY